MLALAVFTLLALGPGNGELQVRQILQIPAQPQQTITAVTTDPDSNVIAAGQNDLGTFVTKLDSSGNSVFTLSEIGSYGYGVAADANGDVYWIGASGSPTFPFPFTGSVLGSAPDGHLPGFLVKLHGSDGSIAWSMEIGAMNPNSVTIGPDGSVVVAGAASSASPSATQGAYAVSTIVPATPIEVVKFSPDGSLIFAATYGGSATTVPAATQMCDLPYLYDAACPNTGVAGVLVDPQNHVWITGSTNVTDLPTTANALNSVCTCASTPYDGFLAELSADGSPLLYGSYIHNSSQGGTINAAAMESAGNIWLGGSAPSNLLANGVPVKTTGLIMEYVPSANRIENELQTDVNATPAFVGNIAVNAGDGTVAIAGLPVYDAESPQATPAGFVETFNWNLPTANTALTGVISLAGNAVGTGLAFGPSGSLIVAGGASVATELEPSGPISPNVVSVTGSATTGIATGQISPGQIITIFGYDLGPGIPATASASGQPLAFPTSLAGVTVLVGNTPAPLLYVSENQINAIVPFGVAAGTPTTLTVDNNGSVSDSATLGIVTATPGVFTTQDTSQGYPVAAALNQDGTINSSTNPAAPGSIVTIFATGLGALTTQPADGVVLPETGLPSLLTQVLLGSGAQFLDILYAGPAPDEVAGVMQINFRLPATNPAASPIDMFVGNWLSQYFTVWIAGS